VDIGIFEFALVLIVGLLVIGPERMPEVARNIIYWWSKIKDGVSSTKADIEREIGADDIRRQLRNEKIMKELGESREAIESTLKETTDNIQRFKHIGEEQLKDSVESLSQPFESLKKSPSKELEDIDASSAVTTEDKKPS